MSSSAVSRIERGQADRAALHRLARLAAVLGARVEPRLLWQGEGLDRLLDSRHATLVDRTLRLLLRHAWEPAAEVSFNIRGERGSIDVLAFHPRSGSLVVVEVKSVVPDMQAMLVALDHKGRLAREIGLGRNWWATSVTRLLVLPDDRTARRRVDTLAATFRSALPARSVQVRRWLVDPVGVSHGILFLSDDRKAGTRHRLSAAASRDRGP